MRVCIHTQLYACMYSYTTVSCILLTFRNSSTDTANYSRAITKTDCMRCQLLNSSLLDESIGFINPDVVAVISKLPIIIGLFCTRAL